MIPNEHFNYILSTYRHPWKVSIVSGYSLFPSQNTEMEKKKKPIKRWNTKEKNETIFPGEVQILGS